jgi:hypothetical protein
MNEVLEAALEQSLSRRGAPQRTPRGRATAAVATVKPS